MLADQLKTDHPLMSCLQSRIGRLRNPKPSIPDPKPKDRANGYVLLSSLCCLFLMLQLCSLCALSMKRTAFLHRAAEQSVLDLSVYQQCRHMAARAVYARRCSQPAPQTIQYVAIADIEVKLEDQTTCIRATYTKEGQFYEFFLFYTQEGVVDAGYTSTVAACLPAILESKLTGWCFFDRLTGISNDFGAVKAAQAQRAGRVEAGLFKL